MFHDAIPLAGHWMLDAVGPVWIDVDDVAELGDARDLVEQVHGEAIEPVVARVVLTMVQHDVRTLLFGFPCDEHFVVCVCVPCH